jgi:dTDP-4-dehydrorhamnose reductase
MLKIAISGSTGLIGTRIIELLENKFSFVPLLQSEVDITDKNSTVKTINSMDFDIFLHMAAYTNVDGAEKDKQLAYDINVKGTQYVFNAVMSKKKQFIYVSTDFVFDGASPPYFEDSKPNPISYYAETKYQGEQIVNPPAGGNAMIVRLSYPYRAEYDLKKDFVKSIVSALQEKKELKMVTDSSITPTFIDDIALGLGYIFNDFSPRIIHLVGADSLSPYEAGKLIAKTFDLDKTLIKPTTFAEYFKNKAKRPQYSEIKSKHNTFYKMKTFEKGLAEVKNQLYNREL